MLPSPDSSLAGVAVSAARRGLHRHLLEIAIVEPEVLAVRDHELRRLLAPDADRRAVPSGIFPGRAIDAACRSRVLHFAALAIRDRLREFGAQRLEVAIDRCRARCASRPGPARAPQPAAPAGRRKVGSCRFDPRTRRRLHHSLPAGGGASTSRAPFGCSGPTTPAVSIALEQPRRAVVADLEPALHVGNRRLALGGHDLHGLVVQRDPARRPSSPPARAAARPRCPASACSGLSSTSSM